MALVGKERLLRQDGFEVIVHIGPEEAVRAYFPDRSDARFAGAQRLVVATVPLATGSSEAPG